MFGIDRETLRLLRSKYPEGSRVRLTKMEDILAPPIGTCGTVKCVDDLGTVHIAWDTGSSLGAIFGEDEIEVLG